MKKQKTTMVTLAMLVCFLCTACGGSGGSSSESSSSSSSSSSSASSASSSSSSSSSSSASSSSGLSNFGNFGGSNNTVDHGSSSGGLSQYVGLWEYTDEDIWLMVYDNETWEFLNEQGVAIAFGSLVLEENSITLYSDDTGEEVMQLDRAVSGDLLDGESGGVLVPAESTYYFTRNGLEINAGVDMGTYLLEDGVCSYATEDGSGYSTGDCYWEVIKNYDETSDGIREIQFDAICYIPRSSLGDFDGKYNCNVYHQLYDFYTGKWFTRSSAYKNSTRGDDYYVHSVEWNGQSDIIEYTRSSDWQSNVGEWAKVLTVDYHVYMPEGYDGLVLVNAPQPDNYEAFEIFNSQHTTFSEASIMEIDLLEPYGCLFFNVCDGVS